MTYIPRLKKDYNERVIGELKKDPAYLEWTHEKALKKCFEEVEE